MSNLELATRFISGFRRVKESKNDPAKGSAQDAAQLRAQEFKIVREVLDGNNDEFRHLVSAHKNRIFSMVMRTVGERPVAEELTQEIFVRAYSSLAKFRFEASFSTWITCIALNHTNSYFQSKKYKQKLRTVSFQPKSHDQVRESGEELQQEAALVESFREALEELKPDFRDIIVLCALEGKSYEEVAGILAVPIGTVRSRLCRARDNLRLLIEQKCGAL